ncbi:MAG: DUF1294 domain-containing protein [Herpetosiphonaceae bacterium]|nr:DUF1294 domain-containing protein [Herpetosiphonaceae bacterium]
MFGGSLASRSHPVLALGFGFLLGLANLLTWGNSLLGSWLLLISIVAFVAFVIDKNAARRSRRRTSERGLLTLVAIGGTLGAGLAMLLIRHKTSKRSFMSSFWLIVGLQVLGLIVASTLHSYIGRWLVG